MRRLKVATWIFGVSGVLVLLLAGVIRIFACVSADEYSCGFSSVAASVLAIWVGGPLILIGLIFYVFSRRKSGN